MKNEQELVIFPPSVSSIKPTEHSDGHYEPIPISYPSLMTPIKQISCGFNFTILLDSNMRIFSFGSNEWGQLGYPTPEGYGSDIRNVQIARKFSIEGIRCGFTHAVVFGERECYGWGEHQFGALGYEPKQIINNWTPRKLPVLISPHQKLIDVSCGNNTTVFKISENFYCLGDNRKGQLGLILKKPTFQPQKISIQSSKGSKSSRLVKVKAGDGFTVGLDQNYQLYGAGDVGRLGLTLQNKNMLPIGLCPLEEGYKALKDVKDFHCGSNLVLKLDSDRFIIFSDQKKPFSKIIENGELLGQSKEFILVGKREIVYTWYKSGSKVNQIQKIFNYTTENHLEGSQGTGEIILVQNFPNRPSKTLEFLQNNQEKFKKIKQKEKESQKQTNQIAIEANQKAELQNLRKEVNQQKEIIKLFQQYVSKLESENEQLKSKLNIEKSILTQRDDSVINGLAVLKLMLKDMLKQHLEMHGQSQ